MVELIITRGTVASGKSTWAKQWVKEDWNYRIRVERDELRRVMFKHFVKNTKLTATEEDMVTKRQDAHINDFLKDGFSVVVSDTNIDPKNITRFRKIAEQNNATFVVKEFDTPLDVCLERNAARPETERIPENVVRRMHKRLSNQERQRQSLKFENRPFNVSAEKQVCFISDIDGTLQLMNGRNPFDSMASVSDLPNCPVIITLLGLQKAYPDAAFIFLSGREIKAYDVTMDALESYGLVVDQLYMRQNGDFRKDTTIKEELYSEFIEPFYNVVAIFDDRKTVVDLWRNKGLACFQVAPGDF